MSALDSARSVQPSIRTSALDQTLLALAQTHAGHAAAPILPCPLCFEPPMDVRASLPTANGVVSSLAIPASHAAGRAAAA